MTLYLRNIYKIVPITWQQGFSRTDKEQSAMQTNLGHFASVARKKHLKKTLRSVYAPLLVLCLVLGFVFSSLPTS